jgi:uncharacterized membrane protein YagU involved in acid resistance
VDDTWPPSSWAFAVNNWYPKTVADWLLTGEAAAKSIRLGDAHAAGDHRRVKVLKTPHSILGAILLGGFIAGTIDIGAAALINNVSVPVILKAIASGILGKASFQLGIEAESLGVLLQWAMSIFIAAIFVVTASRMSILKRQWLAGGLAYGVGVFFVMNYVVVPLSAIGRVPHFTAARFIENLLAMLLFGVIIAFFARSAQTIDSRITAVTAGD